MSTPNNQEERLKEFTPVELMDRAVICLYIELPLLIAEDVSKKWKAVKAHWQQSQDESYWISVKDRLPEPGQDVLLWTISSVIRKGDLYMGEWRVEGDSFRRFINGKYISGYEFADITHWMPLPNPPSNPLNQ